MGLKQLLLLLLATLPAEMSIRISPKFRAELPQINVAKRDLIRVCGRDYERTVIYACSAHRHGTKRSLQETRNPLYPGNAHHDLIQTYRNEDLDNVKFQSAPRPELNQLQDDYQPFAESSSGQFFDLYKQYKKQIDAAADDAWQKSEYPVGIANRVRSGFPQVKYPKTKREGPTDLRFVCCHYGCTYDEIVRAHC